MMLLHVLTDVESERDAKVLVGRLLGRSYAEIGRRLGIDRAAVHRRFKRLQERHPEIQNLGRA